MATFNNGRGLIPGLTLAALGLGIVLPAFAHHSFALFDHKNRVTVTGTVLKFEWTNPHVFIQLEVPEGTAS